MSEQQETKKLLKEDLEKLLDKEECIAQSIINDLGGNFNPESEGMTMREWILAIQDIIQVEA